MESIPIELPCIASLHLVAVEPLNETLAISFFVVDWRRFLRRLGGDIFARERYHLPATSGNTIYALTIGRIHSQK
ncbi:hypothetical protein BOC59_27545 [Burkholderia pseudomallei]|nr:hypothetical protein BOC59_27545 [Burkholderia pseudomallei]